MSRINTIVFDLSEVYLQWLKWTEYKLSPILWIDPFVINRSFFTERLDLLFHWKISEDEYLFDLINSNNWDIDILSLKKIIRSNFVEIEWTREIIELLKEKWYKLWLLSVHAKEWIEYCNIKYNYHYLFDYVVYSFDIWVSKPNKKSFIYILELLKEEAKNVLFIDDNEKNIEASIKLWINSILFKNSKDLLNKLNRLKIL